MSVGTGWGVWFLYLNSFELKDVLLLRTNTKWNLIFQYPELFVFYSKTTSFFPPIFNPLEDSKAHNYEKQHQTDLVSMRRKI